MSAVTFSDEFPVIEPVAVAEVPCSRGGWCLWAEVQIEEGQGWGQETELLRVLAGRATAAGRARIAMPLLMRKLKKSESTIRGYFRRLRERGVLRTQQCGDGQLAVHQLLAEPLERQLSLFDDVGRGQHDAASAERPTMVSAAAVCAPPAADTGRASAPPSASSPPVSACQPSGGLDPAVEGAVTATEEGSARERATTAWSPLSPSLPVVLEILERAPELHVVEAAVDAALRAFPGADHEQAAYRVLSWAMEGGLGNGAANRLLFRALERQALDRPGRVGPGRPAARRRGGPHDDGAAERLRQMRVMLADARGEPSS